MFVTKKTRGAIGPLASSLLLLALASLSACTGGFNLDGSALRSYAEKSAPASGLVINLSRDAEALLGSWEEASLSRYGIVEGEAAKDGSFVLRFYSATTATPVGQLAAAFGKGEGLITGKVQFGSDQGRAIVLEERPQDVAGLKVRSVRATSSVGLAKTAPEPTRFYYFGFEPLSPPALRDWYRKAFQGGKSLLDIMRQEKIAFLEDFEKTTKERAGQVQAELLPAWYYDGRQFLSFRGKGLLVMGLRRSVFTGGQDVSHNLLHAVIDETANAILGPGDFLIEGWEEALVPLLTSSLKEELGLAPDSSLQEQGFLSDKVEAGKDFVVYSKGLCFHYGPGKLGPAALGDVFILLPFDRLQGLLRVDVLAKYGLVQALESR
jgi:hypothetical protein